MPNKDEYSEVSSELQAVVDAFNSAISSANKAWLTSVTLSLVAIGAAPIQGSSNWSGFQFSGHNFFTALALALVALTFRLCVTHSNMYEAQLVFHKYLRDIGAEKKMISNTVSLKDVAHRLTLSAYNRFFPVLFAVPEDSREHVMNWIKPKFESLFLLAPHLGLTVALFRAYGGINHIQPAVVDKMLLSLATILAIVQVVVFVLTLAHVVNARKRLVAETFDNMGS